MTTQTSVENKTGRRVRHSPMEHPQHQYPREVAALQDIARSCGLVEKIKWGKPCFMLGNKNIVLIQRFNDYIALLFFRGALLKDPGKLLSRVGEHMQAPRQLRFRSLADVTARSSAARTFIEQAIELEKAGAKVVLKDVSELAVPEELQSRLDAEPALKKAFIGLTPGRQKGYIYQIASAKQAATRASRVAKFVPRILVGKGLND
ncbi:MAG TPA: YdeI/OmpD-associated family protein [Acidobacteriaceae bacterium]|nr:YdeI/OmpD-associated family protein [Acidobacteriaceae bacterium]